MKLQVKSADNLGYIVTSPRTGSSGALGTRLRKCFSQLIIALAIAMPLKSDGSETVAQEVSVLSRKLKEVIAKDPTQTEKFLVSFTKRILDANEGKTSLASQMTNRELLTIVTNIAPLVPPQMKVNLSETTGQLVSAVNSEYKTFLSSVEHLEQASVKLAETQNTNSLFTILRNSSNEQRGPAFIAFTQQIHTSRVEFVAIKSPPKEPASVTSATGSKYDKSISSLNHIMQDKNRCVSTCGLMALQRLVGADFSFEMLPPIGDIYSERAGKGQGARPYVLFPLIGLDVELINFSQDISFKNKKEALTFAQEILQTKIVTVLKKGDFVTMIVNGNPASHAVLITGVHDSSAFILHDPEAGSVSLISSSSLAKRWVNPEDDTLVAHVIKFSTQPHSEKKALADKVQLKPSAELMRAGLVEFDSKKREPSLEAIQSSCNSFRWVDLTSSTREGRDLSSMDGIPLVIKMQIIGGMPVRTTNSKREPLLITGYSGGFMNSEASFTVLTKGGEEVMEWKKLLRTISVKNEFGHDTIFLGYLKEFDKNTVQVSTNLPAK